MCACLPLIASLFHPMVGTVDFVRWMDTVSADVSIIIGFVKGAGLKWRYLNDEMLKSASKVVSLLFSLLPVTRGEGVEVTNLTIMSDEITRILHPLVDQANIQAGKYLFVVNVGNSTLSSAAAVQPVATENYTEMIHMIPQATTTLSSNVLYMWDVLQANFGVPVLVARCMSGYVLLFCLLTIVPGFVNATAGKLLRWPILLVTYFQILVELVIYASLRFFIKAVEYVFQSGTHRRMRREIWNSGDYEEWLGRTRALDKSQGRDWWQRTVTDDLSSRYNWAFIRELMKDLRASRESRDLMKAVNVLGQCTRKNVGGVMSNELFAFTNSGEPKFIVSEFIEEVCKTLKWITDHVTAEGGGDDGHQQCEGGSGVTPNEARARGSSLVNSLTWGLLGEPPSSLPSNPATRPDSPSRRPSNRTQRNYVKQVIRRARAAYGRTGLCLSGGAAMGRCGQEIFGL